MLLKLLKVKSNKIIDNLFYENTIVFNGNNNQKYI